MSGFEPADVFAHPEFSGLQPAMSLLQRHFKNALCILDLAIHETFDCIIGFRMVALNGKHIISLLFYCFFCNRFLAIQCIRSDYAIF